MKSLFRTVLAALLLLMPMLSMHAGPGQPWERLLDRYELICKKCLELKHLRDAGENVPASQMQDLLSELESLRAQLKSVSDRMPVAARLRFDNIRKMYASGEINDSRIAILPRIDSALVEPKALGLDKACIQEFTPDMVRPKTRPVWTASASVVAVPDFAWGAMVCCTGKHFGGGIAFRSNYAYHATGYDALSDGSSGDSRIWTSGASASDLLFLTAGPVFRLNNWLSLFGGAGYGYRRLCWEDTDGVWMKISDASPSGICTELGASLYYSNICVSLSWIALPPAYGAAAVSVGYRF